MFWLFKIVTNKKLVSLEKKARIKYIEDTNFLIGEIKKLNALKKTLSKTEIQSNIYLKAIYDSDLDNMIFVLEMINKSTNFLWVSRKKVEKLRAYVLKVRITLKKLVNLSELSPPDSFITKQKMDTRSIFALAKLSLDSTKFDFSFDNFKAAV